MDLTTIAARREGEVPKEWILRIVAGDENLRVGEFRTMPVGASGYKMT
jgi:hypothetical protein